MIPPRPIPPNRLHRKLPRLLLLRQPPPQRLNLLIEPLILIKLRRILLKLHGLDLFPPIKPREDVQDHAPIPQAEPPVETAVADPKRGGDGRADEIPVQEIRRARVRVGADDAVALEDQDVARGRQLFPEPGRGQEAGDVAAVGHLGFWAEMADHDGAGGDEAGDGGAGGDGVGGEEEEVDGPFGAEDGGEVEEEGGELVEFGLPGFDYYSYVLWLFA